MHTSLGISEQIFNLTRLTIYGILCVLYGPWSLYMDMQEVHVAMGALPQQGRNNRMLMTHDTLSHWNVPHG